MGIARRAVQVETLVENVVTPLGHVAVHIVKAPGIGLLFADGMSFLVGIVSEPSEFNQLARIAPKRVIRVGSGATCIFPLGLGRQSIAVGLKIARGRVLVVAR